MWMKDIRMHSVEVPTAITLDDGRLLVEVEHVGLHGKTALVDHDRTR